jgi:hypothetical protein
MEMVMVQTKRLLDLGHDLAHHPLEATVGIGDYRRFMLEALVLELLVQLMLVD